MNIEEENDDKKEALFVKPLTSPSFERGNVVVEIDVEDYNKGVEDL